MLGHKVFNLLDSNKKFEVYNLSRTRLNNDSILLDIKNFNSLFSVIKKIQPSIIINCAGVLVSESSNHAFDALLINSMLPLRLSDLSKSQNFKLIHISTDCVFSGERGPYKINDDADANDIYGLTKYLGEKINLSNHLVIRTSIIGPDLKSNGQGLLHWFLTSKEKSCYGWGKAKWSGISTLECAKAIQFSIENNITGIHHLTPHDNISKFKLLELINSHLSIKKTLIKEDTKKINKTLINETKFFYEKKICYKKIIEEMIQDIVASKQYAHYMEYL